MFIETVRAPTRNAYHPWILIATAGLIALAAFSGPLLELIERWSAQEEYSHGYLIPIIAALLLWGRRDALLGSMGRPVWLGLGFVLLASGMLIIGELSSISILGQLGFIIALLGVVLAAGGYPLLQVAFIPILLLIFAIPAPAMIDSTLSWGLQLLTSELGAGLISLFQIPVYVDGTVIDLGDYKLEVVKACSGLRYLYPLLSLGFLAAYMFQAPFWKRALVFLSTIPLTIVMNSLRIGILGVAVHLWGSQMAEGLLHFFEGWIFFLAGAAILATEIYLLARIPPNGSFFDTFHVPSIQAVQTRYLTGTDAAARRPLLMSVIVVLLAGIVAHQISHPQEIVPERPRFADFPSELGEWQGGHQSLLNPKVELYLGLDDYIDSDYGRTDGASVNLYVAYYASQRNGITPRSLQAWLPGSGWQITNFERKSYTNHQARIRLPYNRAVIERDGKKQIVYYWFDQLGRQIANEYLSKWYLLEDTILRGRTDGALVRLTTAVAPDESETDAEKRLRAFIIELAPQLKEFLPS